jgi:hypothetical protein
VLGGISEDEEVVVSGNFLIDSESQIQFGPRGADGEAARARPTPAPGTGSEGGDAHQQHQH